MSRRRSQKCQAWASWLFTERGRALPADRSPYEGPGRPQSVGKSKSRYRPAADDHRPSNAMSRPRSASTGPAAAASRRRRRALTYDDLPKEIKLVIHRVKRAEFSLTVSPRHASRRGRADAFRPRTSRVARDGAEIEPFSRRRSKTTWASRTRRCARRSRNTSRTRPRRSTCTGRSERGT